MMTHEQRVIDELKALDDKISKLTDFMHGDIYAKLAATDQGLMMVQVRAMKMYSQALFDRVSRF